VHTQLPHKAIKPSPTCPNHLPSARPQAGQTIEQIQRNSGARAQLSRTGEFYPGTSERVLLVSGPLHSVLTAVFLMLKKLPWEQLAADAQTMGTASGRGAREDQVKLAICRKLCGAVIGQRGQTIRDFMVDSGATIRVQPLSELTPGDSERLVSVSGARHRVLRAVALILNMVRRGCWCNKFAWVGHAVLLVVLGIVIQASRCMLTVSGITNAPPAATYPLTSTTPQTQTRGLILIAAALG